VVPREDFETRRGGAKDCRRAWFEPIRHQNLGVVRASGAPPVTRRAGGAHHSGLSPETTTLPREARDLIGVTTDLIRVTSGLIRVTTNVDWRENELATCDKIF